jgi:hypothetical protein
MAYGSHLIKAAANLFWNPALVRIKAGPARKIYGQVPWRWPARPTPDRAAHYH